MTPDGKLDMHKRIKRGTQQRQLVYILVFPKYRLQKKGLMCFRDDNESSGGSV